MMICHHRMGDNDNGPDRVIVYIHTHKHHQRHGYHQHNQWLSKSRLQYLMRTLVAPEDDKDPHGEKEHLYMYRHIPLMSQQLWNNKSRVSDRSRSPQRKESPQRQKGKKTTAEVKKPSVLPKAKKHEPMDSDEDDEVPQNEHGTSSSAQLPVPLLVLPLRSGSTSSSHGPLTSTTPTNSQRTSTSTSSEDESADIDDEHGERESGPAVQSARGHGSGRTVFCPDLHVLTNDEHWTMTPEAHKYAHKYAAAAGSFCFVNTENGEQQDIYNLTTIPCVQRSWCLDEVSDRRFQQHAS